ncbi:helix-turn-helix domain-containing protein [Actinacidiphila bryophytorum]|uniref:helix-turn-helix domain-containing protein n=1 Tax=Actinacidiphila bryophytorum TaxID=1436133 RepID=UPI002176A08D|nr:helix-turn-helix transcriptional regulator [Actinacidiphila bryophytorum]UWE10984.1 helix-turn-helix transcriptional regulator [Actinacidiphila bryophytorum]
MTEARSPLEHVGAVLGDISRWAPAQDPKDVKALAAILRSTADALERQARQESAPSAEPGRPRRRRQRPRSLHHEPQAVTWARERAGLTKRALARRIGISEQLLGEIESGWRSATPSNLVRIADALDCRVVLLERRRQHATPVGGDGNAAADGTPGADAPSPRPGLGTQVR